MVTSEGRAVPPPTDEHLDAALWRIHDAVTKQIAHDDSARSRRRRRWGAGAGGMVLVGIGIAIGGAALPAIINPAPAFEVQCFASARSSDAEMTVEFTKPAQVAAAKHDPVSTCQNVEIVDTVAVTDIASIVTGLVEKGSQCGVVISDGRMWRFDAPRGDLIDISSGTSLPPAAPGCVTLHVSQVTSPVGTTLGGVACSVSDVQARVYPGSPDDIATICDAHGLRPYPAP